MITSIGYNWAEAKGFTIDRPNGIDTYTVILFENPVEIMQGDEKILTNPGAFIIYEANKPQWYRMPSNMVHHWFHVSADSFLDIKKYPIKMGQIYYPNSVGRLIKIFSELNSNFYDSSFLAKRLLDIKVEELIITCCRDVMQSENVSQSSADAVRRAHKIMLNDFRKVWSVNGLAKLSNMSESHFYNVYRSLYGTSPINTLIKHRINTAKALLLTHNYSVSEVADEVGYKNIYHFIRYFKKETGITPAKYAKK